MNFQQTEMATPEHVVVKYRLAGLGSRSIAHILDLLLISLVILAIILFMIFVMNLPIGEFIVNRMINEFSSYLLAIIMIVSFLLFWGYFALFEFFTGGQTPGKMLTGLRVIQDGGQSLTFLSAIIRNILRIVDSLPSFYLLGITMIFLHPRHKRVGDLVAGTLVVYEGIHRKKKRKTPLEIEIEKRGITADFLSLDPWAKSKLTNKEWKLLSTYMERRHGIPQGERDTLAVQIAKIILPMVDVPFQEKTPIELENDLFALYLIMKEEWEYKV